MHRAIIIVCDTMQRGNTVAALTTMRERITFRQRRPLVTQTALSLRTKYYDTRRACIAARFSKDLMGLVLHCNCRSEGFAASWSVTLADWLDAYNMIAVAFK